MLVENWMTKDVITAEKNDSVEAAANLLAHHGISIIPVMEKGILCGIVSFSDLYRPINALAAEHNDFELKDGLSPKTVGQVMSPNVIAVTADFTVEETIDLLIKNKIHGAPVIDARRNLIGVITQTDLLKAVVDLTGAGCRGIKYAFMVADRPGSIKELSDTIRSHGGRLASILTSCVGVSEGYRRVYIRMHGIDRFRLNDLNEALKEKATLVYVVDHLEIRKAQNAKSHG